MGSKTSPKSTRYQQDRHEKMIKHLKGGADRNGRLIGKEEPRKCERKHLHTRLFRKGRDLGLSKKKKISTKKNRKKKKGRSGMGLEREGGSIFVKKKGGSNGGVGVKGKEGGWKNLLKRGKTGQAPFTGGAMKHGGKLIRGGAGGAVWWFFAKGRRGRVKNRELSKNCLGASGFGPRREVLSVGGGGDPEGDSRRAHSFNPFGKDRGERNLGTNRANILWVSLRTWGGLGPSRTRELLAGAGRDERREG